MRRTAAVRYDVVAAQPRDLDSPGVKWIDVVRAPA